MPKNSLRIIGGKFKGRRLDTPPLGTSSTRPTLDRVRVSLFDMLAYEIQEKTVLDLCAGTGALGLEALSRGAKSATFVEEDKRNVHLIQGNIQKLGVENQTQIFPGTLPSVLKRLEGFSFERVFFDPPYSSDLVERVLPELVKFHLLSSDAMVVVERDRKAKEILNPLFRVVRRHKIGDTELWLLKT